MKGTREAVSLFSRSMERIAAAAAEDEDAAEGSRRMSRSQSMAMQSLRGSAANYSRKDTVTELSATDLIRDRNISMAVHAGRFGFEAIQEPAHEAHEASDVVPYHWRSQSFFGEGTETKNTFEDWLHSDHKSATVTHTLNQGLSVLAALFSVTPKLVGDSYLSTWAFQHRSLAFVLICTLAFLVRPRRRQSPPRHAIHTPALSLLLCVLAPQKITSLTTPRRLSYLFFLLRTGPGGHLLAPLDRLRLVLYPATRRLLCRHLVVSPHPSTVRRPHPRPARRGEDIDRVVDVPHKDARGDHLCPLRLPPLLIDAARFRP